VKIAIEIDGRAVAVEKGSILLHAARRAGAVIPTLCHHEALKTHRPCRLCLVEVVKEAKARMVTSCVYPLLNEGEKITTDSTAVREARREVMETLLARCPGSEQVRELALSMGIPAALARTAPAAPVTAKADPLVDCILCGLCVRACNEAIGAGAIAFAEKGSNGKPASPFKVEASACIGCGACVAVCPTGVNSLEEDGDGLRRLPFFGIEVPMRRCEACGTSIGSEAQLRGINEKVDSVSDRLTLCPACRRKDFGRKLSRMEAVAT
jgi:predicted molibdopterin-dependent oxidoreductase YjgC